MNNNRVLKNAIWIICGNIVKALLNLCISLFSARYLGPENFGLINYAASIVSFFVPIMYLGLNAILVQELVNNSNREEEILGTAIFLSFLSSIFCIFSIFCFTNIVNSQENDTIIVTLLYSILLIFQSIDLVQYWFQANYLSKYNSVVAIIAYIIVSAYKIFLLITRKKIYWFAISNAIDYAILSILLLLLFKLISKKNLKFSWNLAKEMLKKSKYYIISGLMVTIFAQTDKIMIKLILGDRENGLYSAAVACAGMSSFIFSSIIDSFRPLIFEKKKNNDSEYSYTLRTLNSIIIYLSIVQCVFITVFSKYLIQLLYGSQYLDAANVLKIIVWYTTFSYLGSTRNIWIIAENKQKYIWLIDLSGAICNVLLNFIFIPLIGICGAAIGSLITQIFTNIIISFFIKPIRYNNKILYESLNIRKTIKFIYSKIKIHKKVIK